MTKANLKKRTLDEISLDFHLAFGKKKKRIELITEFSVSYADELAYFAYYKCENLPDRTLMAVEVLSTAYLNLTENCQYKPYEGKDLMAIYKSEIEKAVREEKRHYFKHKSYSGLPSSDEGDALPNLQSMVDIVDNNQNQPLANSSEYFLKDSLIAMAQSSNKPIDKDFYFILAGFADHCPDVINLIVSFCKDSKALRSGFVLAVLNQGHITERWTDDEISSEYSIPLGSVRSRRSKFQSKVKNFNLPEEKKIIVKGLLEKLHSSLN